MTQKNLNLIDALSKVRRHSNDNGSTEVQIILHMIKLNRTKYHTERNLLDTQVSTQEKTNRKDIDAIRSSKRISQVIKKEIKYLARNTVNFQKFLEVLNSFNIEYKKYLSISEKHKIKI